MNYSRLLAWVLRLIGTVEFFAFGAVVMPIAWMEQMHAALGREIARLTALQQVNPNVRPEEVAALVQQQAALAQHIQTARLRLDSVRLIRRGLG